MSFHQTVLPHARRDQLIICKLHDEVLVYDDLRDEAICLNDIASKVWRCCDGATTPRAIARDLSRESNVDVDERLVWLALAQLSEQNLLETPLELPVEMQTAQSRRDLLRSLGAGIALAVPTVVSIVVPTPAQGASCLAMGELCTADGECCSGLCIGGLVCA